MIYKMGHWEQNQASAMAIAVLWPEFNPIQFKIICIALLRYNRCKAALQEIKFLQYMYIVPNMDLGI